MQCSHLIIGLCAAGCLNLSPLARAGSSHPRPANYASSEGKIRCALSHGVTAFIVRLAPKARQPSLTFVNENPSAEGKFSIAVANERLAANSPKWRVVDGAIRFQRKRLFAVSLVGVEANYVKLTFEVENPIRNANSDPAAGRLIGPGSLATR